MYTCAYLFALAKALDCTCPYYNYNSTSAKQLVRQTLFITCLWGSAGAGALLWGFKAPCLQWSSATPTAETFRSFLKPIALQMTSLMHACWWSAAE